MASASRTRLLVAIATLTLCSGCGSVVTPQGNALPADALLPSPRIIVGRIVAVDRAQGFAFVELASDAPSAALVDGSELISRTANLDVTGRLRSSRYVRGRTLGTKIVEGQPAPSDEVVWLAP
jgi:hypothetical protein